MKKTLFGLLVGVILGAVVTVGSPALAGSIQLSDVYDKVKSILTNTKTIKNNQSTLNDNDLVLGEDHVAMYDLLLYADWNAYIACIGVGSDNCLDSGNAPGDTLSVKVQAFREEHGLTVTAQQ